MERFLFVGMGGALGAVARYAVSLIPVRSAFPVLTLLTNFLGALVIGFISGLIDRQAMGGKAALFWKTGVCGGFTTFSTFSLEAWKLLEDKKYLWGGSYIVLSVVLCLCGVILGKCISKVYKGM